jgi:protein SCO1
MFDECTENRLELKGRADIEPLVNAFYERVRKDELLGFIFDELARTRWEVHLSKMGFTRCKFACPRTLGDMQRIEKVGGESHKDARFVFLSIDPDNDVPEQMKQAMTERGMDAGRWLFLTAPEPVVRDVAVALKFQYQWVEGFLAHSNLIAVMDEQGRVVHRDETLGGDL